MHGNSPDGGLGVRSAVRAPGAPRDMTVAGLLRESRSALLLRWEQSLREDPAAQATRPKLALRGEVVKLIDRIALAIEQLDGSPDIAVPQVDWAGSWLAQEAFSDVGALGVALGAFSHLRRALIDLFFAEGVTPTRRECHVISATIDAAVAAVATKMHDAEQKRMTAIRDRFLAILGHDLRNPLNAITIAAGALRRHDLRDGDLFLVNRAVSGAERMGKMITDLLEFAAARLVPETFVPAREDALLATVCEEAVGEMRLVHPLRTIVLDVRDPGAGAWDRHRLVRVLSNLLGNALAYSPPQSKVTVTVAARGERMLVSVHNEGVPIEPGMLRSLFEPFERGPGAPGKPGGLGLGLFIARQIARAHEGDITVESSERAGTTFTLELPVVTAGTERCDAS
jgi:signal transduction histidine kinase